MTDKTEAQRLAELCQQIADDGAMIHTWPWPSLQKLLNDDAALLLKQEAAIKVLREALTDIADDYSDRYELTSPSTNPGIKSTIEEARAALTATEGL